MVNSNEFLQPREAVRAMRPYTPPTQGRENAMRLDFNENTIGCSPAVLEAITSALTGDRLAMYPEYNTALSYVAAFLDVPQDNIMLTNGTDEAIQVLVNTFIEPGSELLILHPSYAMYRFYAEVAGVKVHEVDYNVEDGLRFPLQALLDAIKPNTRAIFVANPNNPTGTYNSHNDFVNMMKEIPSSVLVILDLAYFEYVDKNDYVNTQLLLNQFPNLLVTKTFSKIQGLASLRIGYGLGSKKIMKIFNKIRQPFNTNSLAQEAAFHAINDKEHIQKSIDLNNTERKRVSLELESMGFNCIPSQGNFIAFKGNFNPIESISFSNHCNIVLVYASVSS